MFGFFCCVLRMQMKRCMKTDVVWWNMLSNIQIIHHHQFPYWCAPSLANRSASSLYWSPLWPDTWMNSICMELVSKSLLNSIKSHLFASGSPLALQNPFRSQRGSHLSTALHKNSESVFMRKYLTRSRMQSLITWIAPWISPALFVARPSTGSAAFLVRMKPFCSEHRKSSNSHTLFDLNCLLRINWTYKRCCQL